MQGLMDWSFKMTSQNDKRRFNRQRTLLSVRVATKASTSKKLEFDSCVGQTIDLGGGGMLLKIEERMPIDEVVGISFLTPNTFNFFKGDGRVVRRVQNEDRTYGVALEFIGIPDSEKKLLDYYLHR